jgi:hypothetical protein
VDEKLSLPILEKLILVKDKRAVTARVIAATVFPTFAIMKE